MVAAGAWVATGAGAWVGAGAAVGAGACVGSGAGGEIGAAAAACGAGDDCCGADALDDGAETGFDAAGAETAVRGDWAAATLLDARTTGRLPEFWTAVDPAEVWAAAGGRPRAAVWAGLEAVVAT